MKRLGHVTLLMLAVLAAPGAHAGDAACKATLSGSVTASFECVARLREVDASSSVFELYATKEIEGIPSVVPGAFILERPVRKGNFTLETLGPGRATVAKEGGTLFIASKTTSKRGEVTLTITSVTRGKDGAEEVHGTYRARLLPAGGGKTGEVIVEAVF